MNALVNYLQELKLAPYASLWSYQVSGNVIELNVLPPLKKDPQNYRLGIIRIGGILFQLRNRFKDQITTNVFPNFLDNSLPVTVRLSKDSSKTKKNKESLEAIEQIYPSLFIRQTLTPSKEMQLPKDIPNNKPVEVLSTYSENPFIWLQFGNYLEILLHKEEHSTAKKAYIFQYQTEQKTVAAHLESELYPQAILFDEEGRS